MYKNQSKTFIIYIINQALGLVRWSGAFDFDEVKNKKYSEMFDNKNQNVSGINTIIT